MPERWGRAWRSTIAPPGDGRCTPPGLPSLNVTALARGNGYLYIGADNGLVRIAEKELVAMSAVN